MGQVSKLHHTVPRFYLRGFADQRGRVTTVRLPDKRLPPQSIDKTAATNHFYAVDGHPDGRDSFEKALSEVEADTAPVLRAVLDGAWPLDPTHRTQLGYFLAMQVVRGPDHRRNIGHLAAQVTRIEARAAGRSGAQDWVRERFGVEVDEAQATRVWERATNPAAPFEVPPPVHIDQMITIADQLVTMIIARPWALVRFERRSLITCDAPVGLIPGSGHDPTRGVGFLTAEAVTVPLSRRNGLIMSDMETLARAGVPVADVHEGKFDTLEPGSVRLQSLINTSTISSACECVYLHPGDEGVLPERLPEPRLTTMRVSGESYGDEGV